MNLQIRGENFVTDHTNQALTGSNGTIEIPYAVMERKGFNMRFLYDAQARASFNGDWGKHRTDKHIAMIRIPSPDRLRRMDLGLEPVEKAWELPKVNVGNDRYFVDVVGREILQVNNTNNRIPFQAISDKITHLELAYDSEHKKAFQGKPEEMDRNPAIQRIQIPSMINLDPEFMRVVMKQPAFEARQELEQRLRLFEQQWERHTHHNDSVSNGNKRTKSNLKR
jgi:hypothetical protein